MVAAPGDIARGRFGSAALAGSGHAEIGGAELVSQLAEERHAVAAAQVERGAAGALRKVIQRIEVAAKAGQYGNVLPKLEVIDYVYTRLKRLEDKLIRAGEA